LLMSCLGAWQRSLSINMLEWLQCLNCTIDWFITFQRSNGINITDSGK
jgi:hypothetical protein